MGKSTKRPDNRKSERALPAPFWMRAFVWSVLGGGALTGFWALGLTANHESDASWFIAQGWGQYASVIVRNKITALWHATAMMLSVGGVLWFLLLRRGKQDVANICEDGVPAGSQMTERVFWVLLLLVMVDVWMLARQYVKTMPIVSVAENPVVAILKQDMPEHRVALLSQQEFYGSWLTFLFPYHGISAINTVQAPRMSEDYKNFLGIVGRNPIRMWRLSAVGYVLAPVQMWTQIQNDPAWKDSFDLVYSYDVSRVDTWVNVIPATPQFPGKHVVLRLKQTMPRFALIGGYEVVTDDEALKRLASPAYALSEKVLVSSASPIEPLDGQGINGAGLVGTCKLEKYRSGRVVLDVQAERAAFLRFAEKYDGGWKATVDSRPVPVYRVDYIFQGVPIPVGEHHVVMQYSAPAWGLVTQCVGFAIVLGAAIWLLVGSLRRRNSEAATGQ